MSQETLIIELINTVQADVAQIKKRLDVLYITKAEFEPVKKVTYGLVGTVLALVAVALSKAL